MKLIAQESRFKDVERDQSVSNRSRLVDAATVLFLAFPVIGTFFPPESYFAPQDFSLQHAAEVGAEFPIGRYGYALLLGWLIASCILNIRTSLEAAYRNLPMLLLGTYVLATAYWSADPSTSFNRSARLFILVAYACYLGQRYEADKICDLLLKAFLISIVASFLAVILIPQYGFSNIAGYENAWRGALSHKNSLGATMSIALIVAQTSLQKPTDRKSALTVFVGATILALMSFSATSVIVSVATIAFGSVLIMLNRATSPAHRMAITVLGISLLFFSFILSQYGDDILLLFGREPTLTGREGVWAATRLMIDANPVWGYGHAFWGIDSVARSAIWRYINWAAPHAHNTWLDLWLQLGLVGLIPTIAIMVIVFIRSFTLLFGGTSDSQMLWPLLLLNLLIRGVSENVLIDPEIGGMFWLALSYSGIARAWSLRKQASDPRFRFNGPEAQR